MHIGVRDLPMVIQKGSNSQAPWSQNPFTFLKMILKFTWTWNSKKTLEKKQVGGLILPDFNVYYNATVIKTVGWNHIAKDIDQQLKTQVNRTELWNPERLHIYG